MQLTHCVRPCGLIDKALEVMSGDAGSSPVMVIKLMLYNLYIIIAIKVAIKIICSKKIISSSYRPCGLMDKTLEFGSGDCRFKSCHGWCIFFIYPPNIIVSF